MPNPVVRWQILSPEPQKVTEFYQKLFSWKATTAKALGYRGLRTGVSSSVDGGVRPALPQSNTFVQLFIDVEDMDASHRESGKIGC